MKNSFEVKVINGNLIMKLLKLSITILICLLFSQIATFAQTKVDEYSEPDSDSESAYMDNFISKLYAEPESKGLIIIYSGDKKERIGNILNLKEGIRTYIHIRFGEKYNDRVSVVMAEG